MKKELNVKGLDCGHCALALEKYIQTVDGVKSCNVNFSTSKVFLDIDDNNYKIIMKNVFKKAKEINPDVKLSEEKIVNSKVNLVEIFLYCIGLILALVVVFVKLNPIIFYILLVLAILFMGYKTYYKALLQLRHFKINENTLITISIVGACGVGEFMEGLMVIALYTFGKFMESKAVNYSRKSISKLISAQPEFAMLLIDGKKVKVKPETVKIGDIIVVAPGEKVPLDGVILEGDGSVDKKHLTGESLPVSVKKGDIIESGSFVNDCVLKIKVEKEYKDSTVSKILSLVTDASNKKSKTETFVSKFSSYYTLGVIIGSVLIFLINLIVIKDFGESFHRGLITLVISCPCAFAISVPLTYFSGIGRCSKDGILVKGSNYLDFCSKINTIVFDKTGTLTSGKFKVVKIDVDKKYSKELKDIVVAGESNSIHPIAKALCEYFGCKSNIKITQFKELSGKGVTFNYNDNSYSIGRGKCVDGLTMVIVKKNKKEFAKIYLQDEIKDSSYNSISEIKKLNIKSIMLTGDNLSVAKQVSDEIGLDEYKGELLPKDKFDYMQNLKNQKNIVSFVGDGINDAPVLALSDVGISMGIMGSPATIEASDVVIADDNLNKIPKLIKISKFTKKIVTQNIVFAGITKLLFLLLGSVGITTMLLAVFADVGVTLLTILNSIRVLKYKSNK